MVARGLLLPALLWIFCSGCGMGGDGEANGPITETLSRADVTDMPRGSASGASYSGMYLVEASRIEACNCRTGSCEPFSALTGATSTVTQVDGLLTSAGDGTCTGGVDADGHFWCGEAEESVSGAVYGRQQGRFLLAAGTPSSKEFTVDTTVMVTIHGQVYDCDLHASGSARYVSSGQ